MIKDNGGCEVAFPTQPRQVADRNLRVIARLDVKNGQLIKGIHLEGLRVLGDPNEFALKYYESGIDEIIFMDPVASFYGRNTLGTVLTSAVDNIFVPITAGGGIRSVADATRLLRAGADKVALNTAAVQRPELIRELAEEFGSQAVVLSIEAKKTGNTWLTYVENGREPTSLPVLEWINQGIELGAGEVLLTSIDKEGTQRGFDIDLISMVDSAVEVPLIVSGGMGSVNDLDPLIFQKNLDAVAIAGVLHYEKASLAEIKVHAREIGFRVREASIS